MYNQGVCDPNITLNEEQKQKLRITYPTWLAKQVLNEFNIMKKVQSFGQPFSDPVVEFDKSNLMQIVC